MNTTAKTKICMVIGDPIEHSLSPQMHNAGYNALHIDDQYMYVARRVEIRDIRNFVDEIRAENIHGVSCTFPIKIAVMPYLDTIDDVAKKIGAVNTIVNDNGKLTGYNTDWLGILTPLEKLTNLRNKTVALIGAGGAARAVAYAVTKKGAKLTIYNRTLKHAMALAQAFEGIAYPLEALENVTNADIIINTTPIGFTQKNQSLLPKKYLTDKHIVFDVVYGHDTQLLTDARTKGARTINGKEMLLYQGTEQFKLYTGKDAPIEAMRKALV